MAGAKANLLDSVVRCALWLGAAAYKLSKPNKSELYAERFDVRKWRTVSE